MEVGVGGGSVLPESTAVSGLLASVELFRQRPKGDWDPKQLEHDLIRLRHVIDLQELEFAEMAATLATAPGFEDDPGGATDFIRHECNMATGSTWASLAVGRQLGRLPQTVAAVNAGEIGYAHLAVVARTVDALRDAGSPLDEADLLGKAKGISVGRLWHLCQDLRHAADQERFAREQAQVAECRSLKMSTLEDGSMSLHGFFDPIGGAAIRSALEPLAKRSHADDDRCTERRFADALVELTTHAMDVGSIPQRPHLQVTTTLETLQGLDGAPAADLQHSVPVSAETVQRLACEGTVTRIVFGPGSVVIDVGRARRIVSNKIRRALDARDGHCQWPGCDRPPSHSQAHHLRHWAKGGSTDLDNMLLLCHRHHWMSHEGGWQLVRTVDGRLLTVPPPHLRYLARAPSTDAA